MRYYVEIFLDKSTEILVQDTSMALLSASQRRSRLRELTQSEFVVLVQEMKVEIQTLGIDYSKYTFSERLRDL